MDIVLSITLGTVLLIAFSALQRYKRQEETKSYLGEDD